MTNFAPVLSLAVVLIGVLIIENLLPVGMAAERVRQQ
jgi:hypothetical protein